MKFLVFALALSATSAFAEIPVIIAKYVTCAKLQEDVANYKHVVVVKKVLGLKIKKNVFFDAQCSEITESVYVKTADSRDCKAGEVCGFYQTASTSSDSDYSSSSSSDYSSGSDSSYDSGSSSSSSSSSDNGPSYNPPSTSYEGPSYNPPSSGTRGSNYCPSC